MSSPTFLFGWWENPYSLFIPKPLNPRFQDPRSQRPKNHVLIAGQVERQLGAYWKQWRRRRFAKIASDAVFDQNVLAPSVDIAILSKISRYYR
ncbi:hypothetical protein DVH24_009438 [Malus domestica]|uniref:Uncharacterized protein n=1 Tax=Malus domestica TaxID=3750 RepID=A0A498IU12_MALDO|nr:hypothetical protein DVH24_009438 [Malus domestica]